MKGMIMAIMHRPFTRAEYGMIERAVKRGYSRDFVEYRLSEVLMAHEGDNLVCALVYWGFATELQATKYVASLS